MKFILLLLSAYIWLFAGEMKATFHDIESLQDLYELSLEIRNENIDCVGNIAIKNEENFQERLSYALENSENFIKELDINQSEKINQNFQILEFWEHKSIDNSMLFKKFNKVFKICKEDLFEYFSKKFKEEESRNLTDGVLNEILKFAINSRFENFKFSQLDNLILSNEPFEVFEGYLFSNEISQNELDIALNTALLHNKDLSFIKSLIKRGANVNSGDENSLFFAINNIDHLKFLISAGANINHKNIFGKTPIFSSVNAKNEDVTKFLIYNGASINVKEISEAEANTLASNGEEICGFNDFSKTLLMYSASYGGKNITELLVKSGANEFKTDEYGLNALDYAIFADDNETIEYLKSIGLKSNLTLDNQN